MIVFKSRFIYPIYFLLLVVTSLFSVFFVFYLFVLIPQIITEGDFSYDDFWFILIGMFMFGYFTAQFNQIVVTLRFGIVITEKEIILKDYLIWRETNITTQIKGYSSSYYGYKNDIKCLIIYLKDNRHINMPRYMYFNYKDIEPAFQQLKLPFLGNELFVGKYIISRAYRFDDVAEVDKSL